MAGNLIDNMMSFPPKWSVGLRFRTLLNYIVVYNLLTVSFGILTWLVLNVCPVYIFKSFLKMMVRINN